MLAEFYNLDKHIKFLKKFSWYNLIKKIKRNILNKKYISERKNNGRGC
jgi:hypothetical protein